MTNNYQNKFDEFKGMGFKDIRGVCTLKLEEVFAKNDLKKQSNMSLLFRRILKIISWNSRFITRLFKKKI